MKKMWKMMACAWMAACVVSCSDEEMVDKAGQTVHPVLAFTCETTSRGVVNTFPESATVGVYLAGAGTSTPYQGDAALMNMYYRLQGDGSWTASVDAQLTTAKADVYAYYPYGTESASGKDIRLTDGTDHLYTRNPAVIDRNNPAAALSLGHAMALLKFGFDSSLGNLTRIRVRGVPVAGTLDVFTGKVTPSTELKDVELLPSDPALTEGLLVVPGRMMDVQVYSEKGTFVWKSQETAAAGKQYRISLKAE